MDTRSEWVDAREPAGKASANGPVGSRASEFAQSTSSAGGNRAVVAGALVSDLVGSHLCRFSWTMVTHAPRAGCPKTDRKHTMPVT
jgi:hypothetical protein